PRQGDDRLYAVLAKGRLELAFGVGRVHGSNDRAAFPGGELGNQELRAVGEQQTDPIAAPDAKRAQRGREVIAEPLELAVRERAPFEQHGRTIRLFARSPADVVEERSRGVGRQRRGDLWIVAGQPRGCSGHQPRDYILRSATRRMAPDGRYRV